MIYSTLLRSMYRAVFGPIPAPPIVTPRTGLVLVADGVGGLDLCGTGLQYMAALAKLPHEVQVLSWGHGFGRWHADLTNATNRDAKAAELAALVATALGERPDAPVFLVGKSGGTGVVVRALELLPADSVEAAVLIAPALSPDYDLSHSLRAVRREISVFWSPLDVFVLGVGTRIFGTIDRVNAVSAGLVGFRVPARLGEADRAQYAKLQQRKWQPEMASTGYFGGHVGPDSPVFLRKYVVPLLDVAPQSPADDAAVSSPRHHAPIT